MKGIRQSMWVLVIFIFVSLGSAWSMAEKEASPVVADPQLNQQLFTDLKAGYVIGAKIIDLNGKFLGKITDLVFDSNSGNITSVVFSSGSFFYREYSSIAWQQLIPLPSEGIFLLENSQMIKKQNKVSQPPPFLWIADAEARWGCGVCTTYGCPPYDGGATSYAIGYEYADLWKEDPYREFFDQNPVIKEITGEVVLVERIIPGPAYTTGIKIVLHYDHHAVPVYLGPSTYLLSQKNPFFQPGSKVTVTGFQADYEPPFLIATSIGDSQQTIQLRNTSGSPLWIVE